MGNSTYPPVSVGGTNIQLQQTITSSGSVTIPSTVTWLYAILIGGGGGGQSSGGGAGAFIQGWTTPASSCVIGAGGTSSGTDGGKTTFGLLIAGGGGGSSSSYPGFAGAGSGGFSFNNQNPDQNVVLGVISKNNSTSIFSAIIT